jgi:hypothetical protein
LGENTQDDDATSAGASVSSEAANTASGGPFVAPGPDGAAPSPQLEAFREGLQITEAILHLHAALADPQSKAAIEAGLADEVKATIQVLMDVMESNRRVRPAGTADVWPVVRRLYRLASEILPDKPA